jgi:hypothetical protein
MSSYNGRGDRIRMRKGIQESFMEEIKISPSPKG